MRYYVHIVVLAAVVMLLNSCSRDEVVQGDGQIMSFKLVTVNVPITRATDNLNETFVYPIDFTVAVDGNNHTYTANSAVSEMTSSLPARFPISGNSVRIQAYYPSFKMSYSETPQTFTVEQDQSQTDMGIANYRISDLMYGLPKDDFADLDENTSGATRKVKVTANTIPLVFEHMMSKISINAVTNGSVIKRIKMLNVKRSIDFNPIDTTFFNLTESDDGAGNTVLMYDSSTGMGENFTCSALIPKQSLPVGTNFIEVVVEDFPSDQILVYRLHEDANFGPGKHYEYRLNVSMDGIEVSAMIAPWDDTPEGWTDLNESIEL